MHLDHTENVVYTNDLRSSFKLQFRANLIQNTLWKGNTTNEWDCYQNQKNCKTSMQYGIDIFWTPKKQFRMTTWKLMYTKTSTHKLIVSEIFFLEWKLNVDKGKYEVLELWDNRISFERNNHANFGLSCLQFDPVELSKIQSYLLFCVEMVTTLFSKLD